MIMKLISHWVSLNLGIYVIYVNIIIIVSRRLIGSIYCNLNKTSEEQAISKSVQFDFKTSQRYRSLQTGAPQCQVYNFYLILVTKIGIEPALNISKLYPSFRKDVPYL